MRGRRQGRRHVEVALGASRVPGTPGVSEELPCPPQNSVALASIQLPPSLFSTPPAALAPPAPPDCTLQLLVFRNGRLFRTLGNTSRPGATGPGRRRGVATPVIFAGTSKGLRPALPHSGGGPGPRPAWPCPHPWRQGTVAPRPVSEDDAGQGRPVKEGTGGEKAPRTRGFTSQTPHISEGLQAQTHVGLPLLLGVCQLPARGACPPVSSLHSGFCSLSITLHLLVLNPQVLPSWPRHCDPFATSSPCLCFDSSLQLPS